MHVNDPAKSVVRRLPLVILLFALALLRAEQGTAELQGRTVGTSRLFHLAPAPDGDAWELTVVGRQARIPSKLVLYDNGAALLPRESVDVLAAAAEEWRSRALNHIERIKEALP